MRMPCCKFDVLETAIVECLIHILIGLWESRDLECIWIPSEDGFYVPRSPHWQWASHRCSYKRMSNPVKPVPWNTEMSGPRFIGPMAHRWIQKARRAWWLLFWACPKAPQESGDITTVFPWIVPRVLLISACIKMQVLNKGRNYSRVGTIQGQELLISIACMGDLRVTAHCTAFH